MLKRLHNLIFLALLLSSCYKPIGTSVYYNEVTEEYSSVSQPIYFDLDSYKGPKSNVYFLLEKSHKDARIYLKVHWQIYSKYRPYILAEDSLKFLLNGKTILSLSPVKNPRVTSLHLEPSSIEEEAIYEIDQRLLDMFENAKSVEIYITGKKVSLRGVFNERDTFNAIADFVKEVNR